MSSVTGDAGIPEPVKKCIMILRAASNDSERFAALFMVTKLINAAECTSKIKQMLFEAIGPKFLSKLLSPKEVPMDCPPQVYKSVALSVLSAFCGEEELAVHPDMVVHVPALLEIVSQADEDAPDDTLIIVSEAYMCLQNIAQYPPGREALYQQQAIPKMCEIYSEKSFQTDEALNILVTLVNAFGPESWDTSDTAPFHAILNKIALDYETDHTDRKFELTSILFALLSSCRKEVVEASASVESWPQSLYKGLFDILGSKIGKKQRDPALKLVSVALDVLGAEWAVADEEKPRVFFLTLMQLTTIEVRMQLDDKANLKSIMPNADLVTCCFTTLEICLSYIAMDQLELEQKEKQSLYTALKGAFSAIIETLAKVSKAKEPVELKERLFVCALVRVLAAWLAQETSAMRNQVYKILPYALTIANDTFYAHRNRRLAEKSKAKNDDDASSSRPVKHDPLSQVDILRLLLPALCHLAVEEDARRTMLQHKQDQVLFECLSYHWTIVHYKKPPVPRSERLKALNEPQKELEPHILEEMKDSRAACISLCNILMNITVLEAKLVENSPTFISILKFIMSSLPELKQVPENISLHGHLAILGLLLLKQQAKKVNKNDFSLCSYIQATIRFLWDAFVVDECNDPTELVVAMSYKEHWDCIKELWFLGMQTMPGVLEMVPWFSEFVLECGWAQGIISMLKKVKVGSLEQPVKAAYQDFLVSLVKTNENVAGVLKKEGALGLSEELAQTGVGAERANAISMSYLKEFRKCPDNGSDLDAYRESLWAKQLGEDLHHMAKDLYNRWLYLRYYYINQLLEESNTVTFLRQLRKKYSIGVITNGPTNSQWEKLKQLSLERCFDVIIVSGDSCFEKPQPEIFKEACVCLGVDPGSCIMVGDNLHTDIKGGIRAGFAGTVWKPLNEKHRLSSNDPKPDWTIKEITDLSGILNRGPNAPELEDTCSNASDGS